MIRLQERKADSFFKKGVREMNQYDTPYFSTEFILAYLEGEGRSKRVQTYAAFRFLSALVREEKEVAKELAAHLGCELKEECFEEVFEYLQEDLYFAPSFAENSYDPFLLYYAIRSAKERDGSAAMFIDKLLSQHAKEAVRLSYDDGTFNLEFAYEREILYWAAFYIAVSSYEACLEEILPEFARIYWRDLHFSCGDFLLYDFLNQYFEQKDVLHHPAFKELNDTLVLATLQSFRTDLEGFTMDVMIQLKHPASQFAGIYQFGAMDMKEMPSVEIAAKRMQKILEYATAYELRNHLFDYHLDEDRTITFENWKEKLKWHYVQYHNVQNMAVMTYFAADVSLRMAKKLFGENCRVLSQM